MDETEDLGLLATTAVLVDSQRDLVVASGADRVRFLHGIVTGDVAGTPLGGGCHATLLTTKAHVVAEMRIFARASDLYLAVPRGEAENSAQALSRYAIMDDFAAAPAPDFALVGLLGPAAAIRLASAGYAPGQIEGGALWSHVDVSGPAGVLWIARVRQLGVDGFWVGGPAAAVRVLTDTLEALHVPRLSPAAAEAARILAGEPAWGKEITGETFPMEVGLGDAIDYGKGCFLGQEPIVRIRDRGHLNWRLVRLDLPPVGTAISAAAAGADETSAEGEARSAAYLPVPGDRLETDSKPKAGRLTSVARLRDGGVVALALAHVSVASGQHVKVAAADGVRSVAAMVSG